MDRHGWHAHAARGNALITAGIVVALGFLAAAALSPSRALFLLLAETILVVLALLSGAFALAEIRVRKTPPGESPDAEATRENELSFRSACQEAEVGMAILDIDGAIRFVNRGFTNITLHSADELIGTPLSGLASPEHRAEIAADRELLLAGTVRNCRAERRFIRKDGVSVWVRTSVSQLQSKGERQSIALVEDITGQKEVRETLSRQAMRDPLTGLPNRRHFEEVLDSVIGLAKNAEAALLYIDLLYIDLDGFKLVNDTLGHRSGDLLLKEIVGRIRGCLRDCDLLARVGGDEFTIVLTGLDDRESAAGIARRLLLTFNSPFQIEENEVGIGASVGISRYPQDGNDSSALLQSADAAMYCAKRSGSNRYQFFTTEMRQDAHHRLMIGSRLRRALDNREISVQFQPLYELASGKLVRFEALCRWFNPELGQVPPDRFIPVAEATGLIVAIGRQVLREACMQALQWQPSPSPVGVAVNVSAVQFARNDYVDSVLDVLRETGLNPALLELELTESTLIQDRDDAIRKMKLLKDLGVSLSIDDFGTGYSSLSYLQHMTVDALKIDRSFTSRLGTSQTAMSMVRAIIAMARALGLRVVAEGIENPMQAGILRQLGCDEVQGYCYGRPEDGPASVDRVLRQPTDAVSRQSRELVTAE